MELLKENTQSQVCLNKRKYYSTRKIIFISAKRDLENYEIWAYLNFM